MSIARLAVVLLVGSSLSAVVHAAPAKPVYGPWGVDYASMDKGVKPGDDFFGYAEGTWLKTTPIAPDKASAGYNSDLPDLAERDVRQIVEEAQKHPTTPIAKQIGDFYAAWMDEAGIEARGLKPVRPYLAQIAAIDRLHAVYYLPAIQMCLSAMPQQEEQNTEFRIITTETHKYACNGWKRYELSSQPHVCYQNRARCFYLQEKLIGRSVTKNATTFDHLLGG